MLKIWRFLNDEQNWRKFSRVCYNRNRATYFSYARRRNYIPTRKVLIGFIEQDYKFITGDNRPTREIMLDLLSEAE